MQIEKLIKIDVAITPSAMEPHWIMAYEHTKWSRPMYRWSNTNKTVSADKLYSSLQTHTRWNGWMPQSYSWNLRCFFTILCTFSLESLCLNSQVLHWTILAYNADAQESVYCVYLSRYGSGCWSYAPQMQCQLTWPTVSQQVLRKQDV